MTDQLSSLQQQYITALRAYVHHGGELALSSAYELGRRALIDGRGVLDMAALHRSAIDDVVLTAPAHERGRWSERAATFFSELLSPFEMSFRGYRAANEDLQRLNEMLQKQKRSLEAVNGELESFSYSVSHDLRGPLRAIDGFSYAVLEKFGDRLDPDAKRHLARIREATRRMAQLIDDMLGLAQVTRREMRQEDVDLSAIAGSICERLRAAAPEREVELTIDGNIHAKCDARLLTVLLENLLGNAWKFTGRRDRGRVEVGTLHQDGERTFFIRDNGAGFDMSYAGKLFGAFQRLHGTADFPGTGIGLASVQRIIHRHGGQVWATGEVDKGATFYFTLPWEHAPEDGARRDDRA